jgi:hypothetical protein
LHESSLQKAIRAAAHATGTPRRVSPHTFSHCFATHLLEARCGDGCHASARTVQELLGHKDVKTTTNVLVGLHPRPQPGWPGCPQTLGLTNYRREGENEVNESQTPEQPSAKVYDGMIIIDSSVELSIGRRVDRFAPGFLLGFGGRGGSGRLRG